MAALLFTSGVCLGLLLTLLAVSVRVTCRGRRRGDGQLKPKPQSVRFREEKGDEEDDGEGADGCLIPAAGRKDLCRWEEEEAAYTSEAAERAERIERRDMIIQEIWMNAYLNGSASKL